MEAPFLESPVYGTLRLWKAALMEVGPRFMAVEAPISDAEAPFMRAVCRERGLHVVAWYTCSGMVRSYMGQALRRTYHMRALLE